MWFLGLLVSSSQAFAVGTSAKEDPRDSFALRASEIVVSALAQDKHALGAAVALVDRHGVVWSEGFGHTDAKKRRAVDADTLFSIQSMTKAFTAVAVLSAVEEGKLDLDLPISTWLPEFEIRTRFKGVPRDQITLRHLLSHQAGFTHEAPVGNNLVRDRVPFAEHVASIQESWLRYPVGARYSYSNLGIDLAGWILSVVDEKRFAESLRERVLDPVGMPRSRLSSESIDSEPNRAIGLLPGVASVPTFIPMQAAAGLYTSANELGRFVALLLNDAVASSKRLLSEKSWREMHTIPNPVSPFQMKGYGLGVQVSLAADGRVLVGQHSGGGYGFVAKMEWRPEAGLGLVILRNASRMGTLFGELEKLFEETAAAMPQQRAPRTRESLVGDSDCLPRDFMAERRLLGAYVSRSGFAFVVQREGNFGIHERGFRPLCLVAPGLAVIPGEGERSAVRFELDAAGRPVRMTRLHLAQVYDYNEGPEDTAGAGAGKVAKYLGQYAYVWWGAALEPLEFRSVRGHLYFNDLLLAPGPKPALYFAANGELLDLSVEPPRWRNIEIHKTGGVEALRLESNSSRGRPVSRSWWRNQEIDAEWKARSGER